MNILHVTPTFWPATYWGGPIFSTYGLCNGLMAIPGVKLKVLTTDAAGPAFSQRVAVDEFPTRSPDGYEVYYTRRVFGQNLAPGLWARLWRMVKWADVVHVTAVYSFSTIPTLLVCRILGKPVVWSPRGALQRWKECRRRTTKAVWESACWILAPSRLALHATSELEARAIRERLSSAETFVIPNGVVIPERPSRAFQEKTFRLIFVGRLHPTKSLESLLEACKLLSDQDFPSWSLTIAGGGSQPYENFLRARIDRLGLDEKVEMIGDVGGEDKEALFSGAHVLVLPSHTENFGMVVAEALARGVPVIASTGTPWERLREKKCGLWVDNSPESLSQAIRAIRKMPVLEMGQRGRHWMIEEFSWSTQSRRMMELYQHLLSSKQARGLIYTKAPSRNESDRFASHAR